MRRLVFAFIVGLALGAAGTALVGQSTYTPYYMGCPYRTTLKVTMPEGEHWGNRESWLVFVNPGREPVTVRYESPGFVRSPITQTVPADGEQHAIKMSDPDEVHGGLRPGVQSFAVTATMPLPIAVELLSWDTSTWPYRDGLVSPMTSACW